ncbi:MAG: exodeoxyribonuclease subunit alpha, partial [Pseudomonadota bacterium]
HINSLLNQAESFGTIHKLLGYIYHSIYFKRNITNPLDCEVLIIDESSMISLPLFYKLISALDVTKIKHLIFLGDPNQLSSVEEGFVFSSLVNAKNSNRYVSKLTISKRNIGEVGQLANAILIDDKQQIETLLTTGINLSLQEPKLNQILHSALHGQDNLINFIHDYNQHYDKEPSLDYIQQLFSAFTRATILSMTNNGSLGVDNLNQQLEARLKQMLHCHSDWYNGRSILIRENEQGLHNGDIGICLLINNKPRIYFADGRSFIPECLPKYSLAYAITIHKSQGSEYNLVRIVIADHSNQTLLSKELIYTAITRAKTQVELFASLDPLLNLRPTKRTSGLTELMSTTN